MRFFAFAPMARTATALAVVSALFLATSPGAHASVVNYDFVPGTAFNFDAAGTISGGFTYDTTTSAMTNIDVTVSGATGFDGTYTFTYVPWDNSSAVSFMYAADSASDNTFAMLFFELSGTLNGSPGEIGISYAQGFNLPGNCNSGGCQNYLDFNVTGGLEIAATPLPAALPLFATGLGALGLVGWRRKRKRHLPLQSDQNT